MQKRAPHLWWASLLSLRAHDQHHQVYSTLDLQRRPSVTQLFIALKIRAGRRKFRFYEREVFTCTQLTIRNSNS